MTVKISELTAIDVLAVADALPVVDASSTTTKQVTGQQVLDFVNSNLIGSDAVFRVTGSVDPTKKLAFEVDGLSAATTRTVTIPDRNLTLISSTLVAEQASTSGTSIDFNSIPTGVKRITVMFKGVSISDSSLIIVQLGDAGGIETSGYLSSTAGINTSIILTATNSTGGFVLNPAQNAAYIYTGSLTLTLERSSTFSWIGSSTIYESSTNAMYFGAGSKSTSQELDRVRVTTNAAGTFDAGAISLFYEQ